MNERKKNASMLYPTFNFIEKRKQNKERQIQINNRAREFRELETPRYMKAWGVTEELKKESYNEWVKLMNQIDEQIKHMIVYSL